MGAINYGSSYEDFVNLGLNLQRFTRWDTQQARFERAVDIANEYVGDWFSVEVCNGYYEGSYINVDWKADISDFTREELDGEMQELRDLYNGLINNGFVQYRAGWCTGYDTARESKAAVDKMINHLRNSILKEIEESEKWEEENA